MKITRIIKTGEYRAVCAVCVNGAKVLLWAACLGIFVMSARALASDRSSWYGGLGVGTGSADINQSALVGDVCESCSLDDDFSVAQIFVGRYFSSKWSLELGYTDFNSAFSLSGDVAGQSINVVQDSYGVYLAGKGFWPISDQFTLHAKLGTVFWNSDIRYRQQNTRLQNADSSTDVLYGIGAEVSLWRHASVGLAWTQYESLGDSAVALVSAEKAETVAVDAAIWTLYINIDFMSIF